MDPLSKEEQTFFDMAVVSILSFQFHPGNAAHRAPDAQEVAQAFNTATLALEFRRAFFRGGD